MPEGVHRTRAKLADGSVKYYFSLRGCRGTGFWSGRERFPRSAEFMAAYVKAIEDSKPKIILQSNADVAAEYFASVSFLKKKPRTRADYRRWLTRFLDEFGPDDISMWEVSASKRHFNEWRSQWMHSPKQYDYCGAIVTLFLNWAETEGYILSNAIQGLEKLYEVDRSEIVWSPSEMAKVTSICPEWVRRILIAATETGLRPGDLIRLSRNQIEQTPAGRRIRIRTNKRGVPAYIPVTQAMANIIDHTPEDRLLILTNASGGALTEHRASEGLRQWRDKAGLLPDVIGYDLRLNDARGTAATRLLRAGLSLAQIAACMGWSIRTAALMIERYAKVSPEETDEVLAALAAAK
ncbi:MAG: tyrosine-type recombinase/integrase [Pseudomonadota bacterium]